MSTTIISDSGLTEFAKKVKNPASYLDVPTGEILWLSAKGCTVDASTNSAIMADVSSYDNNNFRQTGGFGTSVITDTQVGQCFSFGATNRYGRYVHTDCLKGLVDGNITFSILLKLTEENTDYTRLLRLEDTVQSKVYLQLVLSHGIIYVSVRSSSDTAPETSFPLKPPVNKWFLLTFVCNANAKSLLYYEDGVLLATKNYTENFYTFDSTTFTDLCLLGQKSSMCSPICQWTNLVIYPYALTPTQVKTLYMLQDQPLARVHSRNIIEPADMTSSEIETMTSEIFTGE